MTLDLSRLKSDRKLRLFACAVTRTTRGPGREFDRITLEDIATAERFADGDATADDLAQARIASDLWCCDRSAHRAAEAAGNFCRAESPTSAALLDCIAGPDPAVTLCGHAGPPFQKFLCASCIDILAWNDATVPRIARAIYDERAWDRLPVLADALLDAGVPAARGCIHCGFGDYINMNPPCDCASREVLLHLRADGGECPECEGKGWVVNDTGGNVGRGHCVDCHDTGRLPAVHGRGCWVIDLVLGKC